MAEMKCKHEFVTETTGGQRMVAGEPDDNIVEISVCRLCGYVPSEHEMEPEMALATVRDCVCSRCWGQLVALAGSGHTLRVECVRRCGGGFVSRSFAEAQRAENASDLLDVYANLPQLAPVKVRKSEAQILAELGF